MKSIRFVIILLLLCTTFEIYAKMDRIDMLRAARHYKENSNAMFKAATGYELGGGVEVPVTEESRKYDYLETDYHE